MEWQALESKMFASSAYDSAKQILYLRFTSGEVYRYFGFGEELYQSFLNAESHGRHFLSHIRNRFRYERLAKLHAA
jgi:hypothetical protein